MNTKTLLAGLAGGFFAFFGGWLVFGILLMDYYMANTAVFDGLMKDPPDMLFLVLSNITWGILYAYLFQRIGDIKSFSSGFTNGLIFSFIIVFMWDTSMYAFYNLSGLTITLVDIVVGTLFGGLVGGVVGLVLGFGKKEAA